MWLVALAIGTILWGWTLALGLRGADRAALARSALATAPAVLPITEWAVRLLWDSPGFFLVRWPFFAANLLGGLLLLGSFLDAPPGAVDRRADAARIAHAITWCTGSLVSLTMVLDV
jgi:hypothetical protein